MANASLTPAARATAVKIMMGVDMAPRLCMPLILPFGVQMAAMLTVMPVPTIVLAAMWLFCVAWLAMVLAVHHYAGKPLGATIGRVDFWFRVAVIIGLGGLALFALSTGSIITAPWLALKLLIFAGAVVCGLMIRVQLKPFGPAFGRLMGQGPDEQTNRVIANSIARCRPFVYLIWGGLLLCAALGMHLL